MDKSLEKLKSSTDKVVFKVTLPVQVPEAVTEFQPLPINTYLPVKSSASGKVIVIFTAVPGVVELPTP